MLVVAGRWVSSIVCSDWQVVGKCEVEGDEPGVPYNSIPKSRTLCASWERHSDISQERWSTQNYNEGWLTRLHSA